MVFSILPPKSTGLGFAARSLMPFASLTIPSPRNCVSRRPTRLSSRATLLSRAAFLLLPFPVLPRGSLARCTGVQVKSPALHAEQGEPLSHLVFRCLHCSQVSCTALRGMIRKGNAKEKKERRVGWVVGNIGGGPRSNLGAPYRQPQLLYPSRA